MKSSHELQVTLRAIHLGRFILPAEQGSAADNRGDDFTFRE